MSARAALTGIVPAIASRTPSLRWLGAAFSGGTLEESFELIWLPERTLDPDSALRLAWEIRLRDGGRSARVHLDANANALIAALDETAAQAEAWWTHGAVETVAAPDEAGVVHSIPSTSWNGTRYMGVGSAFDFAPPLAAPPLAPGALIQVSDSQATPMLDPALLYSTPITATARLPSGGINSWLIDVAYSSGGGRAATALLENTLLALEWWGRAPRNRRGWDGRGSTLWLSVNVNRNEPGAMGVRPPEFNAWGGGGTIAVGDAIGDRGLTSAGSLEVIGHEVMHNVIEASSRLAYHDEPGAINEGLADFYGMALSAVGDDFDDAFFGEEVATGRDVVSPETQGRPDRYSRYLYTAEDFGGVHTNSALIERPLTFLVRSGLPPLNGVSVTPIGLARTEEIVRAATFARVYDPESSMEEFAGAVVGVCDLSLLLRSLSLGSTHPEVISYTQACRSFRDAFRAMEVLPGSFDADLALTSVNFAANDASWYNGLTLRVENRALGSLVDLDDFEVYMSDELGETSLLPIDRSRIAIASGDATADGRLEPGGTAFIRVALDGATLAPLGEATRRRRRQVRFSVVPLGDRPGVDTDPSNNLFEFRSQPDYFAYSVRWSVDSGDAGFVVSLYNGANFGVPAGLRVTAFERTTAHGPLVVLGVAGPGRTTPEANPRQGSVFMSLGAGSLASLRPADLSLPMTALETTGVLGLNQARTARFDVAGGMAELEGRRQIYLLVDSDDAVHESDERDNLICVNCSWPGPASQPETGVGIRLAPLTNVEALFPPEYWPAARKLVPPLPRPVRPEPMIGVRVGALPYRGRAPRTAPTPAVDPPQISNFTPPSAMVGAEVTILGRNLANAMVRFNGAPATVRTNTAVLIITLVPPGAVSGPISVTTPGGTAMTAAFTVIAGSAVIEDFTPRGGPIGQTVSLRGRNLGGVTRAELEGTDLPIVASSPTEVNVTISAGAMSGYFTLTTPQGSPRAPTPYSITPVITGFAPASQNCNRIVTVTGDHFFNVFEVRVGGRRVSNHSVPSYTNITFTPGCTVLMSGPISVINEGGTATSTASLTVRPR